MPVSMPVRCSLTWTPDTGPQTDHNRFGRTFLLVLCCFSRISNIKLFKQETKVCFIATLATTSLDILLITTSGASAAHYRNGRLFITDEEPCSSVMSVIQLNTASEKKHLITEHMLALALLPNCTFMLAVFTLIAFIKPKIFPEFFKNTLIF